MKYWSCFIEKLYAYRVYALFFLIALFVGMVYWSSKVELDYTRTKALPQNDSFYVKFAQQQKEFGAADNIMFISFDRTQKIDSVFFSGFIDFHKELSHIHGVKSVWSLYNIVKLEKSVDSSSVKRFNAVRLFKEGDRPSEADLARGIGEYLSIGLYANLFYNPYTNFISLVCTIDPKVMGSPDRLSTMNEIKKSIHAFTRVHTNAKAHISGTPYVIVEMANKIRSEMILLIVASAIATLLILFLCFRSINVLLMALSTMAMGVVFCFGIMALFSYKITLLNSLVPTLVVIIGIPNCIYLTNRYHAAFERTRDKKRAIMEAIDKMGFVILLCNIIAAISFFSFCFTESPILIEFGWVAGIGILCLFPITIIITINFLALFPPRLLSSRRKTLSDKFTKWIRSFCYAQILRPKSTLLIGFFILALFCLGILRVKSNSYIIEGLPPNGALSKDIAYFENEFNGLFNVDLYVKSDYPILKNVRLLSQINSLCDYVTKKDRTSHFCLSITEGIKFLRQSFYNNEEGQFIFPSALDFSFMSPYINNTFQKYDSNDVNAMARQFISQDGKKTRISFFIKNIGSNDLEKWIDDVQRVADSLLNPFKAKVEIGGSGIAFMKGNAYVMEGLLNSVILSLVLISICIFFLYRKWIYIFISVIPNLIPLVATLGILGWAHIDLSPSTVIIFSIAFGIANDLTLRIMISYAYEGNAKRRRWEKVFFSSSQSVIFTALVLIFGFSVFCISDMKNVFYIGLLISVAMALSMLCNIIILPILLMYYEEFAYKKRDDRLKRNK